MAKRFWLPSILAICPALLLAIASMRGAQGQEDAVKLVADQRFEVVTAQGRGTIPVQASAPLDAAAPQARRLLITLHGARRNALDYFAGAIEAVDAVGAAGRDTLVVAPQFLTRADTQAQRLPPETLVFTQEGWREGYDALGPAPVSSYAVLDALLAHFADRQRYPRLAEIVMIGHSAGAQVLQRYAAVGRGEDALRQAGIAIRHVVSNPSSYLYFSAERPAAGGTFQPADIVSCPSADRWHYGLGDPPPYVDAHDPAKLEASYSARDVTYLLGMADIDPNHRLLDRSCAGLAEGPYRLARGLSYFAYLRARHAYGLHQRVVEVPDVGHDQRRIYNSPCGLSVVFGLDLPDGCPHQP